MSIKCCVLGLAPTIELFWLYDVGLNILKYRTLFRLDLAPGCDPKARYYLASAVIGQTNKQVAPTRQTETLPKQTFSHGSEQ